MSSAVMTDLGIYRSVYYHIFHLLAMVKFTDGEIPQIPYSALFRFLRIRNGAQAEAAEGFYRSNHIWAARRATRQVAKPNANERSAIKTA